MEAARRYEILAEAEISVLRRWAEAVTATHQVLVLKPPNVCLVHLQARDPVQGGAFFLGEVLISECRVEIDGTFGYGCALGEDYERALCAAIIDAAVNLHHPLSASIGQDLEGQRMEIRQRRLAQMHLSGRTRVDFDVMEE